MHPLALCVAAALLLSTLAACQAPLPTGSTMPRVTAAARTPVRASFGTISVDDLRAIPAVGRPRLIDVREVDEYTSGHVPGAANVPLATIAAWATGQAKDEPLLIICQSGRRSAMACQTLVGKGFAKVTNVAGGTGAWIQKGYPVTTGSRR